MKYIETFREGENIKGIYLCKNKTIAMTKGGKEYYSLILQDKTGTIDTKIWDPNSSAINDFDTLDYIEVNADVISFNGVMQLSVKRLIKASEGEYNPADYLPVSEKDITVMFNDLLNLINAIANPYLNQLLKSFFVEDQEFAKRFREHSAAKTIHHGFIGGLLEHTLAVANLCNYYSKEYPVINKDLLITAAIFHDIGKLDELSTFPTNDYTDDGQLLGHIIMGTELVGKRIDTIAGFPKKLASELKHCIISHHGELEYGSPKKPAIIEALALAYADNTDAKLQTMKELLDKPEALTGEWTGYNRLFESNVRKTSGL